MVRSLRIVRKKHMQKIAYLGIGFLAFLVEYAVFAILINIDLYIAQITSFAIGASISFSGSRYITFRIDKARAQSFTRSMSVQGVSYLILAGANLVVSTCIVSVLISIHFQPFIAKFIATSTIVVSNFFVYKMIIFRITSSDAQKVE